MKPLSSSQLLRIWEEGLGQSLQEKTLRLLSAACNEPDHSVIGNLSIGDRDIMLLQLREWMFGRRLRNMSACPQCAEKIEWETDSAGLHLQALPAGATIRTFDIEKDGYAVRFRLPGSIDIMKFISGNNEGADKQILKQCIIEVNCNGKTAGSDDLPAAVYEAIEEMMAEKDPQADINMHISCPSCRHEWEAKFDIVSFIWAEINNWAQRMLRDIYHLAKAFGWSESDILSMSPGRRSLYLQMLGV